MNLTLNARDAMPNGGQLTIETTLFESADVEASELSDVMSAGDHVGLVVSDTGVGMDAETRSRAFDPFFTRKQVDEGTGLGLSIIYGIVVEAGGHVRVLSEPGKGARFELYWPRRSLAVGTGVPAFERCKTVSVHCRNVALRQRFETR